MKKTVIITGGNKGIGLNISKVFAKDGYTVFVGAREHTKELKELDGDIVFVKTNVKFEKDKFLEFIAVDSSYLFIDKQQKHCKQYYQASP